MWSQDLNAEFILKDSLFGNVRITKNAESNKYSYSPYRSRFDFRSLISLPNNLGKNVIIFGAEMSSSVHANNKNKDILKLGKGERKGLDYTTLKTEYAILFKSSLKWKQQPFIC